MAIPKTLREFTDQMEKHLAENPDFDEDGRYTCLSVQLVEIDDPNMMPQMADFSPWTPLEDTGRWYVSGNQSEYALLNAINDRIRAVYSPMPAERFTEVVQNWIESTLNVDNCWLSVRNIESIGDHMRWIKNGIGWIFRDSPNREGRPPSVSGMRWKGGEGAVSSEWHSNGKITFNASEGMEAVTESVNHAAERYGSGLREAAKIRDEEYGSFEFSFKSSVDLDEYSKAVGMGRSDLKLWMAESETHDDFRRFRGVDMHTWNRLFLDLGNDYAYMTIPGKGCVNAAPRLVAAQGESALGRTTVTCNGIELFV